MDTNALLEAVKNKLGLSDYALARKFFKIEPGSLREMRERGMSDERILQCAAVLEMEPAEALAAIHAERAKNPKVKAAWLRAAQSLRTALGVLLPAAIVIGVVASSSNDAHA